MRVGVTGWWSSLGPGGLGCSGSGAGAVHCVAMLVEVAARRNWWGWWWWSLRWAGGGGGGGDVSRYVAAVMVLA